MLRMLTALILLASLLASTICVGEDSMAASAASTTGCCQITASSAGGQDTQHCPGGGATATHCCTVCAHPQAVTGQAPLVFHPPQDSRFTAVIPHLVPQDFSRIPFIPPRTAC